MVVFVCARMREDDVCSVVESFAGYEYEKLWAAGGWASRASFVGGRDIPADAVVADCLVEEAEKRKRQRRERGNRSDGDLLICQGRRRRTRILKNYSKKFHCRKGSSGWN